MRGASPSKTIKVFMIEIMTETFWLVATACVKLIVPIVAVSISFKLFFDGLYGGSRRG